MTENSDEIALYKKRWFLLAAFCMFSLLTQFLSKSFGTSDEILKVYFNVSLADLDWAVEGLYGGTAMITPLFAYLCFKDKMGLRVMSIVGAVCLLVSCLVIILSVIVPVLFPLMIVSTLLQGVAYSVCLSVGPFFAVLWFPEEQVSHVVTWMIGCIVAGVSLGSILPAFLLKEPPRNGTAHFVLNETTNWIQTTYCTLLYMYIFVAVVMCLLLACFIAYVTDLPPKPPTVAMLLKRNVSSIQTEQTFRDFLNVCKSLFKDVHFMIMNFVLGICYNSSILLILVLSQIVDAMLKNDPLVISRALLSGLVISTFGITAIASGLIVAKCLQSFKIHLALCKVGTFLQLIYSIIIFLSYYYKNVVGVFVAGAVLGVGNRCGSISLFVLVTQHTYPISESMVSIWVTGFGTLLIVLLAVIQRALFNAFSTEGVIIAQCVILCTFFVLSLFMKPINKRGQVGECSPVEANEHTPILSSNL